MKLARFLVPFTNGIQMNAVEQAIQFARNRNAVLVLISLICVSKERWLKGPRLENMQQSKNFLEAVQYRASQYGVSVEQLEVLTSNVGESIDLLSHKLECEAILLFMQNKSGVLLDTEEVKYVIEQTTHKLYIFRLDSRSNVMLQVCG